MFGFHKRKKTRRQSTRSLQIESLETRCLLATSVVPLWSQVGEYRNAIDPPPFTAPPDVDDNHPEDTYLSVFISVGMNQFHDFATSRGSLALRPGERAKWFTVKQGTTADFAVDLKSIDEVFAQSPDFQVNMQRHILYATDVKIITQLTVDGVHQPTKEDDYYLSRFVTAVRRIGLDGQQPPEWRPDTIPFEMTSFDPQTGKGETNTKALQIIAPPGMEPTLTVTTQAGSSSPFHSLGRDYIQYTPPTGPGGDSGEIQISYMNRSAGRILLAGTSITPRTWYADEQALADELKYALPTYKGNYVTFAKDVLSRVENDFGAFWRSNAVRLTDPAKANTADIIVNFRHSGEPGNTPLRQLDNSDYYRNLLALVYQYKDMNPLTYSYYMGRTLKGLLDDLAKEPVNSFINVASHVDRFAPAREQLVKTIAHELGHARGFTGHIVPSVNFDLASSPGYFDLMQQDWPILNPSGVGFAVGSRVGESSPYFMLLLGHDWSQPNVKAALDGISTSGLNLLERRHYPFENAWAEQLASWMWLDDAPPTQESRGYAAFTVHLSHPVAGYVNATYSTIDGTARAGTDYTGIASAPLIFVPYATTTRILSVRILDDQMDEETERFTMRLSAATNAKISREIAQATILDDDEPPAISVGDVAVQENGGNVVFTVTLSAASGKRVTVNYATADVTAKAGADYKAFVGSLSFNPGDPLTKRVTVPIVDDKHDEWDETFRLNLSRPVNATIRRGEAIAKIIDNDLEPGLWIGDVTVPENGRVAVFSVRLDAASDKAISVTYATANGTAVAGRDYSGVAGTLVFRPGEPLTKTITVAIFDDTVDEWDETFTVNLSAVSNATLRDGTAAARIVDNDAEPSLSIVKTRVRENGGQAVFTVTLSAPSEKWITVGYATANGSAKAGKDYKARSGTLTFAPGTTSLSITVPLINDKKAELDETFTVNLSAPVNASILHGSARCKIVDKD